MRELRQIGPKLGDRVYNAVRLGFNMGILDYVCFPERRVFSLSCRILLSLSFAASVSLMLCGCGGASSPSPQVTPTLVAINVQPANAVIQRNQTQQFTALGIFSSGPALPLADVSWSLECPTLANISSTGLLTAGSREVGNSKLTATKNGLIGTAALIVEDNIASLNVSQFLQTLPVGASAQMTVLAIPPFRVPPPLPIPANDLVSWISGNPNILSVSSSGVETGVALGTSAVTARAGCLSASQQIQVAPPVASITVTPGSVSLPQDTEQAMTATAVLADGEQVDVTGFSTWTSNDTNVVRTQLWWGDVLTDFMHFFGKVGTGLPGSSIVTAGFNAVRGTGTLTVTQGPTLTFVVQGGAKNSVTLFTVDDVTGALTQVDATSQLSFATGTQNIVAADVVPSGFYAGEGLYYLNQGTGEFGAIGVNRGLARLLSGPIPAFLPAGSKPRDIQASPDGKPYAYVVEAPAGTITRFSFAPNVNFWDTFEVPRQQLVIPGAGTLASIRFTPDGRFAYIADCDHGVWTLARNQSTEDLSLAAASATLAGGGSCSLLPAPSGQALFVANSNDGTIQSFQVDATSGALNNMGTVAAGSQPRLGAVDPGGKFLYALNSGDNTISAYQIQAAGTLGPIPGSPFSAGGVTPVAAKVHPNGQFLYVANMGSSSAGGSVSIFKIAADGSLTAAGSVTNLDNAVAILLTPY